MAEWQPSKGVPSRDVRAAHLRACGVCTRGACVARTATEFGARSDELGADVYAVSAETASSGQGARCILAFPPFHFDLPSVCSSYFRSRSIPARLIVSLPGLILGRVRSICRVLSDELGANVCSINGEMAIKRAGRSRPVCFFLSECYLPADCSSGFRSRSTRHALVRRPCLL